MNRRTFIVGALVLSAALPSLGLTGASATSRYTLAGRELADVRGGATTCYVAAVAPCPVASMDCPVCTTAGVPCPGKHQYQTATTANNVAGDTSGGVANGQVSHAMLPSIVCVSNRDCTTCEVAGSAIVCVTPGPLSAERWYHQFAPAGAVCGY